MDVGSPHLACHHTSDGAIGTTLILLGHLHCQLPACGLFVDTSCGVQAPWQLLGGCRFTLLSHACQTWRAATQAASWDSTQPLEASALPTVCMGLAFMHAMPMFKHLGSFPACAIVTILPLTCRPLPPLPTSCLCTLAHLSCPSAQLTLPLLTLTECGGDPCPA